MFVPRRLLVLAGAAAPASRTRAVSELICRTIADGGSRPILRDLVDHPVPLVHHNSGRSALADLRSQAAQTEGMVWVTPCYHGSYSGMLKNCLDQLRREDLQGKPVGVVAVGHSLSAVQACDHLRAVARALGCVSAPTQVVVTEADVMDDADGADLENCSIARVRRMIREIHLLAEVTWGLRNDANGEVVYSSRKGS
ncbi:NADPH-dependent FMN reductase [Nocardia sp. NPDC006044]|uniref:NADPH-dependent FMN reductase n=1 Tax=Nocardia sp. NPDC006044 TaxID=3364306 RepID=UPI0036A66F43